MVRGTKAVAAEAGKIHQPARPTTDAFVKRAFEMRDLAVARGDQGYGAIVVHAASGQIVAQSPSRVITNKNPSAHAEMEAIRGVSVDGPLNRLIELELVHVAGRADLPGRPIQYETTDKFLEFVGIKDLDALPASDVLNNQQIDDWMQRNSNSRMFASDTDVGLAEESKQSTLKLDTFDDESNWRNENIESDAASNA